MFNLFSGQKRPFSKSSGLMWTTNILSIFGVKLCFQIYPDNSVDGAKSVSCELNSI